MKKNLSNLVMLIFLFPAVMFSQYNNHPDLVKYERQGYMHNYAERAYNLAMDKYDVHFYHLDLAVSNTSQDISGNTAIYASVTAATLDTFIIQFMDNMVIDSLQLDGVLHTYIHSGNEIRIALAPVLNNGDNFVVKVFYHGTCSGGGLTSDFYYATIFPTTWTLSESFHAKEWFPCKEVLKDKMDSAYIFLTIDDNLMAGSNGVLENVVNVGGGKLRYEWKSRHPMAYYLVSLCVAEYVEYNLYAHPQGITDSVLIQNYVYDTNPYFLSDVDQSDDLIELYSELYGLYPFWDEKYGHCMAPLGGGMEHQTMTTLGWLDFWLISHEMAHMWFGDNVTCENWQDIWVNEGFASYSEYLANQYLVSQTEADNWMVTAHNYAFDEPQGSIYVPAAYEMDEQRIFSYELSYKKGASIIHTIRFLLDNDTTFFNVLKDFQIQFGDSVATGDDFNNTLASVSGMNFDDFFDQWYYGEGFPTYNVTWTQRNDSLIMDVLQTTSSSYTPFFGNDMEYMIQAVTGDSVIRVHMNQNQQNYSIYFPDSISGIIVDHANWVLNKDTVVFIYTDPNGAEEMPLLSEAINIYPNPAEEMLNIDVRLQRNNSYDIQIVDMAGRVMLNVSEFKNRTAVNVSGLESGIYLLAVSSGCEKVLKRFTKK